jgi:hypothetical protein
MHARALLLDLGDRLCRRGHLFSQRLALRLCLLGSLEQIGVGGSGSAMTDRYPSKSSPTVTPAGWGHWGHIGATPHPDTMDSIGQRRPLSIAVQQPCSASIAARYPSSACHSRAISEGQSRYPADNHGHCHPTSELAVSRSTCKNASREYA